MKKQLQNKQHIWQATVMDASMLGGPMGMQQTPVIGSKLFWYQFNAVKWLKDYCKPHNITFRSSSGKFSRDVLKFLIEVKKVYIEDVTN